MRRITIVLGIGIGVLGAVAIGYEVKAVRLQKRTMATLHAWGEALEASMSTGTVRGGTVHVSINGSPVVISRTALRGDPATLARTACKMPPTSESGETSVFELDTFHEEAGKDGVVAALCTWRGSDRIAYALARTTPDGSVSVTRIESPKVDPMEAYGSGESDAPGSDLTNVPRPSRSRRVMSGTIAESGQEVRMYDVAEGRTEEQVRSEIDASMRSRGWQSSDAVAKELPDARLFTLGAERVVVNFEVRGGLTRVTFAKLALP